MQEYNNSSDSKKQARHAFGAYWLAYADHQRAMSIINDMKLRGRSRDEEIDDVISTFEVFGERLVSILIKQSFTQTLCVYGENVKNTMSCDSAENLVSGNLIV